MYDSIIWRGTEVPHFPCTRHYVYLLHFHAKLSHAQHYTGSSSHFEQRMRLHKNGNGARLMEVVSDAGITWELARLWECESREEALALEYRLKRAGHGPRYCPVCQGKRKDDLTRMREGHYPLASHVGRRRPMKEGPSCLLAGHFASLVDFVDYTNSLIGDELVGYEGYQVQRLIAFQLIPGEPPELDAVILVELVSDMR